MKKAFVLSLCVVPFVCAISSCEKKGPAERSGEKIDEAVDNVKDAVNPKGPLEKAGEKIDKATGN